MSEYEKRPTERGLIEWVNAFTEQYGELLLQCYTGDLEENLKNNIVRQSWAEYVDPCKIWRSYQRTHTISLIERAQFISHLNSTERAVLLALVKKIHLESSA